MAGVVAAARGLLLAVDVGGTQIKAEVLDSSLTSAAAGNADTPRGDGPGALAALVRLCRDVLNTLPEPGDVAGVGLALPGLVDTDAGIARMSANVGWRDTPIAAAVGAALDLPVVTSHDVGAAGYAEWQVGAGRGADDLTVVIVGTGIAAVLVSGGRLLTGGVAQAGELGHVVVRPDGPECACGQRGCLEAVASAAAVARTYAAATGREVAGAEEVVRRLDTDPRADAVWTDAVSALADGLLVICALLAPARIVVGGGLAAAGDALLLPLRRRMVERARVATVPPLAPAELGPRAGLVGAALWAWDRLPRQVGEQA